MERKIFKIISILYAFVYISCADSHVSNNVSVININNKNATTSKIQEYVRDSIYLSYVVNTFEKVEYGSFNHDSPRIFIDTILYSNDNLKFAALIIIMYKNTSYVGKLKFPSAEFLFDGRALIGFRDSISKIWKTYEFNSYVTNEWANYYEVQDKLRYYYFNNLGSEEESVWNDSLKSFINQSKEYNIDDLNFWTKSIVWQKGARIPGLYNFQTKGNYRPTEKGYEEIPPPIQLPKKILQLYKIDSLYN